MSLALRTVQADNLATFLCMAKRVGRQLGNVLSKGVMYTCGVYAVIPVSLYYI